MEQNETPKDKLAPLHAEIFRQLTEIPAFQEYLDIYYDIMVEIDEENHYVNVQVQVLSFEESMKRIEEIRRKKEEDAPRIIVPDNKIIS